MRILVTGASGRLGSYLMARLADGPHEVVAWGRRDPGAWPAGLFQAIDLTDSAALAEAIKRADPEVVIHLAAISSSDAVRNDPSAAWAINVEATRQLAQWAIKHERRLVYTSTDLVFDGTRSWYREDDSPCPILEYGRVKRAAELAVGESSLSLTVRVSLLYGHAPSGRDAFFDRALAALRAGVPSEFFSDEFRTPLDYDTAAIALVKLAESPISGVMHLGGRERLSRYELMQKAAAALGIDPAYVLGGKSDRQPSAERRPPDVSLDTTRLRHLFPELVIPSVEAALAAPSRTPRQEQAAKQTRHH